MLASLNDYVLWYCRSLDAIKYRQLFIEKAVGGTGATLYTQVAMPDGTVRVVRCSNFKGAAWPIFRKTRGPFGVDNITSQTTRVGQTTVFPVEDKWLFVFARAAGVGKQIGWECRGLQLANRVSARRGLNWICEVLWMISRHSPMANNWTDTGGSEPIWRVGRKIYVVQTGDKDCLSDAS